MGMDWSLREGYAWAEDKEHCEEYGRMLQADPSKVSQRAKKRGLPQVKDIYGHHSGLITLVTFCHVTGCHGNRNKMQQGFILDFVLGVL